MIGRPYEGITIQNFADFVGKRWHKQVLDNPEKQLAIMTLGLVGEAGEVSEPIKKQIRGDGPLSKESLKLELGDVLHYWVEIANVFDIEIEDIMISNIEKLEKRDAERGRIVR
jgi:NTP pyrophosphatase (non-canonical NTP hydrolase)